MRKTSVMAREAVCSRTQETNGIRPLYANRPEPGLIGCVNIPVSIIPAREPRKGGGESQTTSVRVPVALCAPAPCTPFCAEHVPKFADYSLGMKGCILFQIA